MLVQVGSDPAGEFFHDSLRRHRYGALRCYKAPFAPLSQTLVEGVSDGTDDVAELSVTGRSVGDASPKYNIQYRS
ncbi:unnamed protein product [Heligmosomoides polygyrus]|uniref:Uncharacterized protein n=1 Tax=Heligmosomoides polygyrus TaxID=6339 RepID=A0A183GGR5_HELPZ|nr:unnamed protein product [Heligmosomoides polygyrus]